MFSLCDRRDGREGVSTKYMTELLEKGVTIGVKIIWNVKVESVQIFQTSGFNNQQSFTHKS